MKTCSVEHRLTLTLVLGIGLIIAMAAGTASGEFNDRYYKMGDDSGEGGTPGNPAGVTIGSDVLTFDTQGTSGAGDFQDLFIFGNPQYAAGHGGGVGIALDGSGDYMVGAKLNAPGTSEGSVGSNEPFSVAGPMNYNGLGNRGFQLWVNPNSATQGVRQNVVLDSNQHGVVITANDTWGMVFPNGNVTDSNVAVSYDNWQHVQVVRPVAPAGPDSGSRMYIDGVAAASVAGGYNGGDLTPLVIGSNTAGVLDFPPDPNGDPALVFTGGTDDYFHGVVDDLKLFVVGDNSDTAPVALPGGNPYATLTTVTDAATGEVFEAFDGAGNTIGENWGAFDFLDDNDAVVALALFNGEDGDLNQDGSVNATDTNAMVAGWRSVQTAVGGQRIGDMTSYANGDMNFNGVVDWNDWNLYVDAYLSATGSTPAFIIVPEPASLALCLVAGAAVVARRRRK